MTGSTTIITKYKEDLVIIRFLVTKQKVFSLTKYKEDLVNLVVYPGGVHP